MLSTGAKKLAKYREKRGLSCKQFQELYFKNLSSQTILYWEKGERKPKLKSALVLSKLKIAKLSDWV